MEDIEELISIIHELIKYNGHVTYTYPDYRKFHDGITNFVIKNNFEDTEEWKNIDKYLLIKSNQYLTNEEANCILTNLEKLKRKIIKKEKSIEGQTVVCYCNICKTHLMHTIISSIDDKGYDEKSGANWFDKYQIIRCNNCRRISFRIDGWFSEYAASPDEDGTYERLYPESTENKIEIRDYHELPYSLDDIYEEVIESYNNKNYILCAVGVRAILEGICSDKNIVKGTVINENGKAKVKNNLEGKIYGLCENGIISKIQQEALHQLRFLGNDAAHELSKPSVIDIKTAIDIIEHILEDIYELPYKTKLLNNRKG